MIDAHAHFFSRPFFEALARQSPLPGTPEEKLAAVAARAGLELPDPDVAKHRARWLEQLDRNGVERLVTFASLPEEAEAVAEAARGSGGRLVPFCLVDPKAEGAAARARALLDDLGFRGLLFFPAMHRFDPSGPEAAAVLAVAAERRVPVVVHCGVLQVKLRDLLGLPRPYDLAFADPLRLVPAANRFRDVTFVIPHFGAGFLRETLMLGQMCENVWVDTSSSNGWLATQPTPLTLADVFARALGVFGARRIVFGTDSSTFPRGWRRDLLEAQRAALIELAVSDADREAILGGNARRLLGA